MSGGAGAGTLDAMNSSDVTSTLRDMWQTRPARPWNGRKIAGVGAAIARRYDLDPVLVRVALVAAAFTGVGLPFYVLAWGLLPGEPADGSPADRRRPRVWMLVLLGVFLVLAAPPFAENAIGLLLPVAAVGALLFLLHRSRASRGIPGSGTAGVAAPAGGGAAGAVPGVTPPAWDPLGAAPFAWDLPEPGPAPVPPPRRRSRVTAVTLAAALLAGGVTALILLVADGLADLPVLLGVVLAVLGGGLVVGAFLRGGRGLIPFALLASVVTWGVLTEPLGQISTGGPRDLRVAPTTAAELAPYYENPVGTVELDLRGMDLTVPPGAPATPVATRIEAGLGSVEIWVPDDADVRFTGSTGVGSVVFAGEETDGPDARLRVDDLGEDRIASGRPIVLDVRAGAGSVEVHRD
jgi:phage shock protein PspC (stress-responsive transcriptional regulator)